MEVFHMYAVLFTNRNEMQFAYFVVETAAIPMIFFTAMGMMLCSAVIMRLSKENSDIGWGVPEEKIPVTVLFQRALLVVTIGLFIFNFIVSYNLQTRLMTENVSENLVYLVNEKAAVYTESGGNLEKLEDHLKEQVDSNEFYLLVDRQTKNCVNFWSSEGGNPVSLDAEDYEKIVEYAGKGTFRRELRTYGIDVFISTVSLGDRYLLAVVQAADPVFVTRTSSMYESTLSDNQIPGHIRKLAKWKSRA